MSKREIGKEDVFVAMTFARIMHADQMYGYLPYLAHLIMVVRELDTNTERVVGFLHDIVEDTAVPLMYLDAVFGREVTEAVEAVTRRPDERYLEEYIPRVAQNPLARKVKMADLRSNIWVADHLQPDFQSLVPRYEKALAYLKYNPDMAK